MSARPSSEVHEQVLQETQGVVSRSVVLMAAKAAVWCLAFVMTILLPRFLGPAGYGRLYFAISFTSIFAIFVEFGLNSLVAREVARRHEHARRYLINAALIKGSLWVLAFLVMVLAVHLLGYASQTRTAVMILGVGVLFTSMSTLLVAILQANDRVRWVAMSAVVEKAVYVALGVTVLLLGYGVVAVAAVILVGYVAGFLLDLWWFRHLGRTTCTHDGSQGLEVRHLFTRALPFFSMAFLGAVYFRIDVFILSLSQSDAVVGWYGAAYKLFETTNFLPEAFMFAMFPVLCRLSSSDEDALALTAQKSLNLLLLAGIPIATGTLLLSDEIVSALYGATEYANSVIVLRVLALAVALMYANGLFTQLLIATDRQRKLVVTAGVAAATNVALNLALIPGSGATGAAIATVVTEVLVLSMNYSFLPRQLAQELQPNTALRAAASAAVMAVPLVLLDGRSLGVLLPTGIAAYLIAVALFKALPQEDWAAVRAAISTLRRAT